jgi:hypothetical protein
MMPAKLLTCETWVTRKQWYEYAKAHPRCVPPEHLLVDRSPCQEPFLDPFAACPEERSPIISGLCRGLKRFQKGKRYLYVTRIDRRLYKELGIDASDNLPRYFGVALRVVKVFPSHEAAAGAFSPRRYVVAPRATPHPPNLVPTPRPDAATARASCIVFTPSEKMAAWDDAEVVEFGGFDRPVTPADSTARLWRRHYEAYHQRMKDKRLRAAFCQIERTDSGEALELSPGVAPILTQDDWGGRQMERMGLFIDDAVADRLSKRIAEGALTRA